MERPIEISIIIPVYNVAQYLPGCLDSVLANELRDCEVILVDDGSTDESGAICEDYCRANPGLMRVIHQPNGGLGAARNTGIEAAAGEWLLFVDSDDKLHPQALATLRRALAPELDVLGFQYYADNGVDPPRAQSSGFGPKDRFTLREEKSYLLALPSAWLRLWRRSLFTDNGLRYVSRLWYEDIRATAKLLALARGIRVLPEPLYYYLSRPGSIMSSTKLDRNREILDAFDDILGWYQAQGLSECYASELEALTVEHVLLAASVRVARQDPKHPLLAELRAYCLSRWPKYRHNPYLRKLPPAKRLALRLVAQGRYGLLRLLFKLKG